MFTLLKLCLNKKYVQDFCNVTGFICNKTKTEQWLNAKDLGLMLDVSPTKILQILQIQQKTNPEIIQIKYKGSWSSLCLHRDYVYKIQEWQQNAEKNQSNNTLWDMIQKLYSR